MKRFGFRVEINAGALGWVDITADVRGDLAVTRGLTAEGRRADPGKLSFTIDNRAGRYSPRNPASDLYGYIGRNTPVRARAALAGDSFGRTISGGWGSTDGAMAPYAWSTFGAGGSVLGGDWTVSGGMGRVFVPAVGAYRAAWLSTLSVADAAVTVTSDTFIGSVAGGPVEPVAVLLRMQSVSSYYMARVEVDASEAVTLKLYDPAGAVLASAPVPSITWAGQPIRLSAVIAGDQLAASVWDPAVTGEPGAWQVRGSAPILTAGGIGLRGGVGAGNTNTLPVEFRFGDLDISVGRFHGEIPSWPPRWSLSGKDRWVNVDAGGLLRRFRQGDQPARSPLRRTIEGSGPVAYWPGEDGELAEQAGSVTSGLSPLLVSGAVAFKAVAAYTTFTGSTTVYGTTALPDLAGGGQLAAQLPAAAVTATAAAWTVHAAVRVSPATLSGDLVVAEWTTAAGTYTRWQLKVTTTNRTQVIGITPAGAATTLLDYPGASTTFHHFAASASISAGTVTVRLQTSYPITLSTTFGGTMGGVTAVAVNPTGVTSSAEMPAGHVAVWAAGILPIDVDGVTDSYGTFVREARRSYLHEASVDRLIRIADEAGLAVVTAPADAQLVSRMGVQPTASTTALLDESVAVDGGLLYESRDQLALAYKPRGELYNVAPVTIAYVGQTSPPFDPADDADDVRNDITVERRNGSSVRAVQLTGPMAAVEPPDGVGIYTTSETLNLDTDADLRGQAAWRLHLGTVAEPRYPAITVQLASPEWLAGSAATLRGQLLALDVGGVLEVTGAPAWVAGRVRTLVTGYTETISEWTWRITYSGPPASPWTVGEVGGSARVAATGSTLAAPMTAGAMSLSLASTGRPWTTNPARFPLRIFVRGELMTLSAISGATSPQTATVSARTLNVAHPSGAPVDVADPAVVAL